MMYFYNKKVKRAKIIISKLFVCSGLFAFMISFTALHLHLRLLAGVAIFIAEIFLFLTLGTEKILTNIDYKIAMFKNQKEIKERKVTNWRKHIEKLRQVKK